MYIAIVEDEQVFAGQLVDMLDHWSQNYGMEYKPVIRIFTTGEDFLNSEINLYDVVFMDIKLGGRIDGIDTAKRMRKKSTRGEIVFLTSHETHVYDGFQVRAMDFIIKPVEYSKIEQCMNRISKELSSGEYVIIGKGIIRRIPYRDIICIQSMQHKVEIHTVKGCIQQPISLTKVFSKLPPGFVQCHRTVILNMDYVGGIEGKEVFMTTGITLPIGDAYHKDIKKSFLRILQR